MKQLMRSKKRRALRCSTATVEQLSPSIAARVAAFLDAFPRVLFLVDLVHASFELMAVSHYFLEVESNSCTSRTHSLGHAITVTTVAYSDSFRSSSGAWAFFFLIAFVFRLVAAPNFVKFLFGSHTLMFLVTFIAAVLVATQSSVGIGEFTQTKQIVSVWSPMFLRVWIARQAIEHLVFQFTARRPVIREFTLLALFLCAAIVTAIGLIQFANSYDSFCFPSTPTMFYFVMITISTLGFGDEVPRTSFGRAVTMLIIFVAMFFLPAVLEMLQTLVNFMTSQNGYGGSVSHVIICNDSWSIGDLQAILNETLNSRVGLQVRHVVLITKEPLDDKVRMWLRRHPLRNSVTVCVSDVVSKGQVARFRARTATAVVILSPLHSIASRGDLASIVNSVVFFRWEPDVPQLMMLKSDQYASIAQRTATNVFQREQLLAILMGIAAVRIPLIAPLLVNLVRVSAWQLLSDDIDWRGPLDPKLNASRLGRSTGRRAVWRDERSPSPEGGLSLSRSELSGSSRDDPDRALFHIPKRPATWWDYYRHGAQCGLLSVDLPAVLDARLLSAAAVIVYFRTGAMALGVKRRFVVGDAAATSILRRRRYRGILIIGNPNLKLNLTTDRLVMVVPQKCNSEALFWELFEKGNTSSSSFGSGASGTDGMRGASSSLPPTSFRYQPNKPRKASIAHWGGLGSHAPDQLHRTVKDANAGKFMFPFHDHLLLLDLSGGDDDSLSSSLTEEERRQHLFARTSRLIRLCREVQRLHRLQEARRRRERSQRAQTSVHDEAPPPPPIVLLTRQQGLNESFAKWWPDYAQPVQIVTGFAGDSAHLRAVGVAYAQSVVITSYNYPPVEEPMILMVVRIVHEQLSSVNRSKTTPVVFDIDDPSRLYLFEPKAPQIPTVDEIEQTAPENSIRELSQRLLGRAPTVAATGSSVPYLNFAACPAFISGRCVSPSMLDAIMYRSVSVPFIPELLNILLNIPVNESQSRNSDWDALDFHKKPATTDAAKRRGGGGATDLADDLHGVPPLLRGGVAVDVEQVPVMLESIPISELLDDESIEVAEMISFLEIVRRCWKLGFCPMAVQREIDTADQGEELIGFRTVITAPPREMRMRSSDFIYALVPQVRHTPKRQTQK